MNKEWKVVGHEPDRLMFTPIVVDSPTVVVGVETPVVYLRGYYPPAPVVVYDEHPYYRYRVRAVSHVHYRPVREVRTIYVGGRSHHQYHHHR